MARVFTYIAADSNTKENLGEFESFCKLELQAMVYFYLVLSNSPELCFLALVIGYIFSARHWLHVFPRSPLVTCFPALAAGYMFSRARHLIHVFPRSPLVTCFPALSTCYMFSRARHWLHVSRACHMFSRAFHY